MTNSILRATLLAGSLLLLAGCGAGGPDAAEPRPGDQGDGTQTADQGATSPDGTGPALEPPSTIARADISSRGLAQDEKKLYFAGPPLADAGGEYYGPDGDLIWSVDKAGGHPKPLFANPAGPVADLAVAGGKVFFSVGGALELNAAGDMASSTFRKGQIMRAVAAGGSAVVVAKNQVEPKAIAADGGQVFWFADGDGTQGTASVRRAAAGGGKVRNVVKGATAPGAVAVAGKLVFWLSTGEDPDAGWTTHLWRATRDGGKKQKLATLEGEPRAVAADEETVFVATAGIIVSVPVAGGDPMRLVEESKQPRALAFDADRIYWTTRETGEVLSVSRQGGQVETLARNQTEVGGIVVDDTAIYWTVNSALRKLSKPGAAAPEAAPAPAQPEEPVDPFAPIAEEAPEPAVNLGADPKQSDKIDPDDLPDKWQKCKRNKQCVLIETGCCLLISVNKKSKNKARKALPRSTCDAECAYENITARCEDKLCRAVLSPK